MQGLTLLDRGFGRGSGADSGGFPLLTRTEAKDAAAALPIDAGLVNRYSAAGRSMPFVASPRRAAEAAESITLAVDREQFVAPEIKSAERSLMDDQNCVPHDDEVL